MNNRPTRVDFMTPIDRWLDRLATLCRVITGLSLVVLTVIFGWLVFGRYVLNATPTWVEQVALLLVMVIAFLGAAVGVHEHSHLSATAMRSAVPMRVRTLLVILSDLFMTGFGALMLFYGAKLTAVKRGYQAEKFPGWQALVYSFLSAIPGLMTAVIIVGGVLSGVFTVTESGAFGAIYAFVVTLLVYRNITWDSFREAVISSVRTASMVMILIACAGAFAYMLTFYQVPMKTVQL